MASALKGIDIICANSIFALVVFAIIDIDLTQVPGEARDAVTAGSSVRISTCPSVQTWIVFSTVILAKLAPQTGIACGAVTLETVGQVLAYTAVSTGFRFAIINVELTVGSRIS